MTTDPSALTCALMQAGLPYRWGFALAAALRLAPLFRLEAHQVYQAQLARGVRYDAGGLRRAWLLARMLLLPLLVSALGKAQAMAISMESRSFGRFRRRTWLRPVRISQADVAAAFALAATALLTLSAAFV